MFSHPGNTGKLVFLIFNILEILGIEMSVGLESWVWIPGLGFLGLEFWAWCLGLESWVWNSGPGFLELVSWFKLDQLRRWNLWLGAWGSWKSVRFQLQDNGAKLAGNEILSQIKSTWWGGLGEILLILHTGPIEKEPFKVNLISDTCACFPIVCERLTVCSRALEMDLPYGLLHGELKCSALNSLHTRNKSCLCTAAGKDCSLQMVFSHLYDTQAAYGSMNDFELHLNGRSCLWCITLEASVTLICV